MAKAVNRHLTEEDTQMPRKHMKGCTVSHAIRKLQIKNTVRYYYIPIRMAQKKKDSIKC